MRKYILSIILIITGVFVLVFNYFGQKGTEYAETAFASQALKFDEIFNQFTTKV